MTAIIGLAIGALAVVGLIRVVLCAYRAMRALTRRGARKLGNALLRFAGAPGAPQAPQAPTVDLQAIIDLNARRVCKAGAK